MKWVQECFAARQEHVGRVEPMCWMWLCNFSSHRWFNFYNLVCHPKDNFNSGLWSPAIKKNSTIGSTWSQHTQTGSKGNVPKTTKFEWATQTVFAYKNRCLLIKPDSLSRMLNTMHAFSVPTVQLIPSFPRCLVRSHLTFSILYFYSSFFFPFFNFLLFHVCRSSQNDALSLYAKV